MLPIVKRKYNSRRIDLCTTTSQIADALGIVTLLGVASGLASAIQIAYLLGGVTLLGVASGLASAIATFNA